jgi:L-iditol 2-dehydrogenase
MMIDLARVMGATKVICVQRSKARMAIARRYEADVYIDSAAEDVVARCRAETGGEGPDIVVTTCGSVDVHEQAIEMVAHRGYVNLFGGLGKNVRPMSVLSNTIHYKECFVTGSHGCVPRHHALAVKLLEQGRVRTAPIVTHHFPLERINEAFDTMENRGGMKIIVHPHG